MEVRPTASDRRRGTLLAAITQSIVGIRRQHYGRGATRAKTYVNDDLITVVTRENGLTPFERTMVESGEPERVIAAREEFLNAMAGRFKERIEELTAHAVLTFLFEVSIDPDITIETFVLDAPLEGFGDAAALRVVDQRARLRGDQYLPPGRPRPIA